MTRFFLLLSLLFYKFILAQEVYEDELYVRQTNPKVIKKLSQWQGLKFGLLMHWGAYSQWGIVESWSLCPEEYDWCKRTRGSNPSNYFLYKQEYEGLIKTFNPVKFNPEKWAKTAKAAGMKYVIFTTKHHDGFCMFDSKYTDYKITGKDCPFAKNPKGNITKEIFNAFRKEGFWAGAYFSKPDWHAPSYWSPAYPPKDRNVNYNPEENPELWNDFVTFTHRQMLELLTDYGDVDILWLDGGWVAKQDKKQIRTFYNNAIAKDEQGYIRSRVINQDIRIDDFVKKAREIKPDLIVVDRAVHGIHQNYLTPENRVPEKTLPYPWESCIISGGGWSYTPNAKYMSGREGIQLLVDIVIKGGNLLLNIAPSPEGEWQEGAYTLLRQFSDWMRVNQEAIYKTQPLYPYKKGNIGMSTKKTNAKYFYYMCEENQQTMPSKILIPFTEISKTAKVRLLGNEKNMSWERVQTGFAVDIPKEISEHHPVSMFGYLK